MAIFHHFHHLHHKDLRMTASRKAQLSFFLILAVVALIGGAVFFIMKDEAVKKDLPAAVQDVVTDSPQEIVPVTLFVQECLAQTAEEALVIAGEQGGYVSITSPDLRVESFSLSPSPTESDAVLLEPYSLQPDRAVPYWWYLKSRNSCTGKCDLSSKRPGLTGSYSSIEQQLSDYVSSHIGECLDFSPFELEGFSIEQKGAPKAAARIGEKDVGFSLSYPLRISREGITHEQQAFTSTLDVRIKELYDLATQTTNLEMEYRFLERHMTNLLVAFSGLEQGKLPPMSELTFKFGSGKKWSKRETGNLITGFLGGYTQLFQVEGTANFDRNVFDTPLKQRLYDSTIIPNPSGKNHEGIDAEFTYLDVWPIYFDLNCKGDVCSPSSANSLLPFMGLQSYSFAYDISFPVLVELRDTEALHGKGYTFRFALEANIRNNEPMKANFSPLSLADFDEPSLLCDPGQRGPANVTVKVTDSSGKPVPEANILYTILDTNCFIGTTDEQGMLVAQFPEGIAGGAITVVAQDAVQKSVDYTPTGAQENMPISISPVLTKNVKVMKKRLVKSGGSWSLLNAPEELGGDEQALVTLTRIPGEGEQDFPAVAQVSGNEPATIQLAPGAYEADISLYLKRAVRIPAETRCSKSSFFSPEVCYTIPEMDFSAGQSEPMYLEGGFKGNITIPAAELTSADTVVFYALASDIPSTTDDLSFTGDIEGNSNTYQIALYLSYLRSGGSS